MISGSWVWSTGHEEELPTVMPPRDDDDDDDDEEEEEEEEEFELLTVMPPLQHWELVWVEVEGWKVLNEFVELEKLPNGSMSACEQMDAFCTVSQFN